MCIYVAPQGRRGATPWRKRRRRRRQLTQGGGSLQPKTARQTTHQQPILLFLTRVHTQAEQTPHTHTEGNCEHVIFALSERKCHHHQYPTCCEREVLLRNWINSCQCTKSTSLLLPVIDFHFLMGQRSHDPRFIFVKGVNGN